jgi:hypothetical protein
MNSILPTTDPARVDRLYALLPAIHRMRDADQGYPLKALLRVIAEQVNVVEDDIAGLYENWFIETAADWAVPYIGDLVGYRPVTDGGLPPDSSVCDISPVLVPRREIANLIRYRRRKGTLALLELLANDVAGWPARAVEFFKLLGWNQNIDHLHLDRHRTTDLRNMDALDLLDGPFDSISHVEDVRRIDSNRKRGRYNIPGVGVFLWRLRSYPVTRMPACCVDQPQHCYTFSILGQDAPLFVRPQPETDPTHIAEELNLPVPIRRLAFDEHPENYYGPELSFAIWADGWSDVPADQPIPIERLMPADLSGWTYVPPLNSVAVDPVLGRFAFPPGQLPKKSVRVSYHYGFPADIGGGEYARPLLQQPEPATIYRVGDGEAYQRIGDALNQWQQDKPASAVIEIVVSAVYVEQLLITLADRQSLQIRAANRVRPVLRLIDWQTDLPDALSVTLGAGSRFTLDGVMVTGRPVQVQGAAGPGDRPEVCPAEVVIRHCTLVPGWGIDCNCDPTRPAEPSLELTGVRARVCISHSIIGAIQIQEDQVSLDPIPVEIADSIVDATNATRRAISAPGDTWAHATVSILRSTVFGIVDVHAMQLGENSIFTSCVNVARRQVGCMRFCYVPSGCRTPRRYHCQPDGVVAAVKATTTDPVKQIVEIAIEKLRVTPQFTADRYGMPAYAQLATTCADEIKRGADDESEMGVYHDLFQPQREANLVARLAEYTPAGMDVGIFFFT